MLDTNEVLRKIKTGDKVKIVYLDIYMQEQGVAPEELPWTTVYEIGGWWYTVGICLANGSVVKILDWEPSLPEWARANVIDVPNTKGTSAYFLRDYSDKFISQFGQVYSVEGLMEFDGHIRVIVDENGNVISEN